MKLIAMISLRNLFRQKRRNLLLGTAIAFGVMILVVAQSFSGGITDLLLNKIIVRVAGHISVAFSEKGNLNRQIFRDKERILDIVRKNVDGIREIDEGIGVFSRVIGHGKSDNMVLVGIDLSQTLSEETRKEVEESFKMLVGEFTDLSNREVENPVIISDVKARYINVTKGDILRMRYTNLFGNDESARLTVVGIVRNDNVFMQAVMFAELSNIKRLMGYQPHEVSNLNITIDNPRKNAVRLADKLNAALKPGIAMLYGDISYGTKSDRATIAGFRTNDQGKKVLDENIDIISGPKDKRFSKRSVLINRALANRLGIGPGDTFDFSYKSKFEDKEATVRYGVTAVFFNRDMNDGNLVLMNEELFYDAYYDHLPDNLRDAQKAYLPRLDNPVTKILATEWELLERTGNTEELQKKIKDIGRKKWKGTTVDVQTMYESASDVLKLENVLNLITISAGLVLFFIILIGVVNTLRMTIRERTREIGTVRAIGMQKTDIRNTFMLESFFLALFASIIGIILSFGVMRMLATITFEMKDNPMSILLVNGHLYFKPTFWGIVSNMILILLIVLATAYLPARRASNLSPSSALRHYE